MAGITDIIKQVCTAYLSGSAVPKIFTATVKETPPDVDEVIIQISDRMDLKISELIAAEDIGTLKKGNKLIVIRAAGGQDYYLLSKVG